ncbi:hypothetical protein ACJIZ3_022061 [Penstemon smallii]|uniref:CASP-like protein n=1 Tax=Penstemon smallii TaxID=265156 RepID=A0ABD3SNF2_9LAMI
MKDLWGSPGTVYGLLLRIGQCLFAAGSIGAMVSALGFSNYTAYCYLIASMGLQILWSFGLACLDFYALQIKRDLRSPVLVSLDLNYCTGPKHLPCDRFELSIILAFVTWFLIAMSSHVMFWILASF